jgi:hypothetical protein
MDTIEIVFDLLIIVALNMTTNQPEKCLTCKDSLTRIPRNPLQRLLPGSARYCVFRSNWTLIPRQTGHLFHGKLITQTL